MRGDVDQAWLLPASTHQFVPPGHLAHFLRDSARNALDLTAIIAVYKPHQGQPSCRTEILVARLLNGYSRGIQTRRQLDRACDGCKHCCDRGFDCGDRVELAGLAHLGDFCCQTWPLCRRCSCRCCGCTIPRA